MPIPVGDLVLNQKLISIAPSASLAEALGLMIEHDFSQLPVLDTRNKPLGVVTSTSISRALLRFGATVADLNVSDATVKIPGYPADEDLLYILDNMLQNSAVFILNASQQLIGILTEFDTTQYFRQRAEDIVLIEDIESTLKAHLLKAYESIENESEELRNAIDTLSNSFDDVRKKGQSCLRAFAKNNEITTPKTSIDIYIDKYFPVRDQSKAFKDLTLSEFIQLAHKAWDILANTFNISKFTWTTMMENVRLIRNKLVHFRGELTSDERHTLRFCSDWFKAHQHTSDYFEDDIKVVPIENNSSILNIVHSSSSRLIHKGEIEKALDIKYAQLVNYFKTLEDQEKTSLSIQIQDIEKFVKGKLPQAAREHANWWIEDSSHTQPWLEAGWKVRNVQLGVHPPYANFSFWPATTHQIKEPYQLLYWMNKLKVSEAELVEAISKVGEGSDLVEIHINSKREALEATEDKNAS